MVVMILERVPASLRGELTRWLIGPQAGVFLGNVSAMVRQKLWELVCQKSAGGGCIIIWSSNTEQGFRMDFWGKTSRTIYNREGLQLPAKT